jgi:hypothetical protein
MATMTILSSNCKWPDCEARATRRVITQNGETDGDFCSRHANSRLVGLAQEEGQLHGNERPTERVKAVK